jgi:hypothetical protein
MNKLFLALSLAFALVAGTVTVTTLQPQPAMADPGGSCNGCAVDDADGPSDFSRGNRICQEV